MGTCFTKQKPEALESQDDVHFELNPLAGEGIVEKVGQFFPPESIWDVELKIDTHEVPDLIYNNEKFITQAKGIIGRLAILTDDPSRALCASEKSGLIESMHEIYKEIILKPAVFEEIYNMDVDATGNKGHIFYQLSDSMMKNEEDTPCQYIISILKNPEQEQYHKGLEQVFSLVQFEYEDLIQAFCSSIFLNEEDELRTLKVIASKVPEILFHSGIRDKAIKNYINDLPDNMDFFSNGIDLMLWFEHTEHEHEPRPGHEMTHEEKILMILESSAYKSAQNHEVVVRLAKSVAPIIELVEYYKHIIPKDFRLKCQLNGSESQKLYIEIEVERGNRALEKMLNSSSDQSTYDFEDHNYSVSKARVDALGGSAAFVEHGDEYFSMSD